MRTLDLPASSHELITFRHLLREDASSWYNYLSKLVVYENTSWNLGSAADLMANFDSYESEEKSSQIRLAVIAQDSGKLLGTIGFHTISHLNRTAEIAYDLSPDFWNLGIGKSIVNSVVDWGFNSLKFVRIQAAVLETNARSISVLERCDFVREGYLRRYRLVRGNFGNFFIYSRLSDI